MRDLLKRLVDSRAFHVVSVVVLIVVPIGMIMTVGLMYHPIWIDLPEQQVACNPLLDSQVQLVGANQGKGGSTAVTDSGVCAAEYFILARDHSYFRLDPNVVNHSLGVAVTYFVQTPERKHMVAVMVPATGDVYLDTSNSGGIAVMPQSIVAFTSAGEIASLNGSIVQLMVGVDSVVATYRMSSIPVYASTHDAILGAVGR